MAEVLKTRDADSPGYTHFQLADPVGQAGAGVEVTAEYADESETFTIVLHGQKEFDVPGSPSKVIFPDGEWTP